MRLILIILMSTSLSSAQILWDFNTGFGSYKMKELKEFQEKLVQTYPVNPKITASFPTYLYYEVAANWGQKDRIFYGASFSYGSSGGRIYYSDYSGSIGSDQLVSFVALGGTVGKSKEFFNDKLRLQLELKYLLMIGSLKINDYSFFSGFANTSDRLFTSTNLAIQPTLSLKYRFRSFGFNSSVGYNLNMVKGELRDAGSSYTISDLNPTFLDWSGVRISAGISFFAKNSSEDNGEQERLSVGLGAGLDYGGLGVNFLIYPQKSFGFFFGAGYALADFGYNGGIKIRKNPTNKAAPYLIAMYGYNAAIRIRDASELNRLFFGPSFGIGVDLKRQEKNKYLTLGVLLPIRSKSVDDYIVSLENRGVKFNNTLLPLTFSIGYRILSD